MMQKKRRNDRPSSGRTQGRDPGRPGLWLGAVLLVCAAIGILLFAAAGQPQTTPEEPETEVTLRMLDVGQGLCVLIDINGEYLLYDGGGGETSSYVVSYLQSRGITSLRYLVASHYDSDHISGLIGVLNTTTVQTILTPDYEADTHIYRSFCAMLQKNGAEELHPSRGTELSIGPEGEGTILVLGPKDTEYENENSRSLVLRVSCGELSILLTGDAQTDAENDMLSSGLPLSSEILVAGHHGSASSTSPEFLRAVDPSVVLISVGTDNEYGHPADSVLRTIAAQGAAVYRTDLSGGILCRYDGTTLRIESERSDTDSPTEQSVRSNDPAGSSDWETGEDAVSQELPAASVIEEGSEETYILNTSSHKFHRPDCAGASEIAESNKQTTTASREELIAMGYSPCGLCDP